MDLFKRTEQCYLCNGGFKVGKNEPPPSACPVCGADLANPSFETINNSIACEHIKGTLGTGDGSLFITNKRVFWLADSGKGADKISVNIPLDDIAGLEDCKKLLRKGVTVNTKSGDSYNFFIPNLGNPQILKDLLTPYVK